MRKSPLFLLFFLAAGSVTTQADPRRIARAEEEWIKAQQDYYEALKREPKAGDARKAELEAEFLAPKKQALEQAYREHQAAQRPAAPPQVARKRAAPSPSPSPS